MSSTTTSMPLLNDEQLKALIGKSDSVEMKLTVPDSIQRSALKALSVDPLDAQIRQVFFFDTPDLQLNKAGLVVRARRIQGKGDDSTVKLRPVVPDDLKPELRASPNFVVEVDAMPGGYVCSASMKGKPTTDVRQTIGGAAPLRKLFSKEQRAFFTAHAPEGLILDALSILGPIFVLKVSFVPPGYSGKMVGEMWLYPDGSRVIELSTKALPADALSTGLTLRRYLEGRGIDLSGDQQTKTKTALEFYAKELGGAAPPKVDAPPKADVLYPS
jgi:hypothetical protein